MKKLEIKFIVGLLVMFTSIAFAQTEVSGTIFDTDGNPIPGATVIVDETTQGTTTDFDGNYSISVSSDQSLQFSSLGFATQIVREWEASLQLTSHYKPLLKHWMKLW